MAAATVLALTNPEAVMLLAVRLVKKPMGLVIDVTAETVLALTNPEAVMLLEVRLVKLPMGLVIDVTALIVLALTYPEAVMLLAVMFNVDSPWKVELSGSMVLKYPNFAIDALLNIAAVEAISPLTVSSAVPPGG